MRRVPCQALNLEGTAGRISTAAAESSARDTSNYRIVSLPVEQRLSRSDFNSRSKSYRREAFSRACAGILPTMKSHR
jgi:hypothetical protein